MGKIMNKDFTKKIYTKKGSDKTIAVVNKKLLNISEREEHSNIKNTKWKLG